MGRAEKSLAAPRASAARGRGNGAVPAHAAPAAGAVPFALDRHVFYWITRVIGARDRQLAGKLRPHGLRVPEWRVLAYLFSLPHSPMGDVADAAALDHTTLSRTVDRLAASGLLARLPDPADLRVTRLALTEKGRARFEAVWPVVDELSRSALALLPDGAPDLLCAALRMMREGLDRSLESGAAQDGRPAAARRGARRIR